MRAIILAVGDELVLGQTIDTNSAWLSGRLVALGIPTLYHQTLADDCTDIAQAIRLASARSEVVLISGGLGPTDDDLTRQALAEAMEVELVLDRPSLEAITALFAGRHLAMSPRNRVQAMHPHGSTMIANSCGTAPGIRAELSRARIYAMPGVPHEMRVMYERSVEPEMIQTAGQRRVILTTKLNTFGLGESAVAEKLGELMDRSRNPKVGTTASKGIVSVRIRSEFPTASQARPRLDQTAADVRRRLGPIVFGGANETLQESVVELLRQTNQTIATAESCTGGLVGKMLTDVPGASDHYAGGWVAYSNDLKSSQLGVPASLLAEHGAVSEPVARALACGASERSGAHLSIADTGIAGPSGGTDVKPVGTVWIALAQLHPVADGTGRSGTIVTQALLAMLPGDRARVRDWAAKCALQMVRLHLRGEALDHLQWARPGSGQAAGPGKK